MNELYMEIKEVSNKEEILEFIKFPFRLYKNSDYWVPPVISNEKEKLDPDQSAFADRYIWKMWMARKSGEILGRIACIIDTEEPQLAKWGWYDVIDDVAVSELLFETAINWAKEKKAKLFKGPMGFTNLDRTGLMTEGFDRFPTISENYNAVYYKDHLEKLQFNIASEYVSYIIHVPDQVPPRITKLVNMLVDRYGWEVRVPKGKSQAQKYADEAFALMNASHAELEGHTVLSDELAQNYIEGFLPLVKTDYSCFVYKDDMLIGFGIALPNYSKAFQKMNGRIWPLGWWHILMAKWFPKRGDLLIIGVHPDYRNKGVTACLFENIMRAVISDKVKKVESNPELKDNESVQNLWSDYNPVKGKEWKTYIKMI